MTAISGYYYSYCYNVFIIAVCGGFIEMSCSK